MKAKTSRHYRGRIKILSHNLSKVAIVMVSKDKRHGNRHN
jgi:hypothetical protein